MAVKYHGQYIIEVIGFTIEGCVTAQDAGANRIELCDNPEEGGTTASYGFIRAAREKLHIDLYPIIRPRGGDFFYSDEEFEIMKTDIKSCRESGCNGVVIGALTAAGRVDKKRCGLLVNAAYPLGVTFHRAFDQAADPFEALEDIIDIGCERILTSGQMPTAMQGAGLIKELINHADDRIIIMPGSGVKAENIAGLAKETGAVEFHTSARIRVPGRMEYKNPLTEQIGGTITVDGNEVRKIINNLA